MTQREAAITTSKLQQLRSRVFKVARLDAETFLELKDDKSATGQAVAIVAFGGLSYGLGITLTDAIRAGNVSGYALIVGGLFGIIVAVASALVWSMTTFLVGTKLFRGVTDYWGLLRPLFFSAAPALLFILISIPFPLAQTGAETITLGQVIGVIVWGWTLIAGVFAVKNAMGFSKERSMLTFIVGVFALALLGGFVLLR